MRKYSRRNSTYTVTAAQDDSQIVASVPGRRIRVLGLAVISGSVASTSLGHWVFRSIGGATSALTGSWYVGGGGFVLPLSTNHEDGWFETALGDGLFFSTTTASAGLQVAYVEV